MTGRRPRTALRLAFGALGAAAAACLVASSFATVVYVTTANASCQELARASAPACARTGLDQHSVAFLLLGVAAGALTVAWLVAGARAALYALALIGVAGTAIVLSVDVGDATARGALGPEYTLATAHAGAGLWLEAVGSLCALAAAVAGYQR